MVEYTIITKSGKVIILGSLIEMSYRDVADIIYNKYGERVVSIRKGE